MHRLKVIALLSWLVLFAFQVALPWMAQTPANYWLILLALPLLVPLRGMLIDRRYTYKWLGFLAMLYFCIGISELVSNPQLRLYGFATTIASMLMFLAGIYYARYLGLRQSDQGQ